MTSTATAKRPSYDIVLVASNDQAAEARSKFPDAAVVVRSGDITADVRSVEGQVGRRPVRVDEGRAVVAAGPSREPIAARPEEPKVDAKVPEPAKVVVATKDTAPPEPKPEPKQPEPKPPEQKVVATTKVEPETKVVPTPAAVNKTSAALQSEVYFGLGSATLGNKASLDKAVSWLKTNADVNAEIGGHADPTGTPEGNMTLSQTRADTVRDYLVSAGIDASRLHVTAFGDTQLKYGRTDRRNRRVAIEAKK